jgi:hypothetical protein
LPVISPFAFAIIDISLVMSSERSRAATKYDDSIVPPPRDKKHSTSLDMIYPIQK